jgi:hypothetical protein
MENITSDNCLLAHDNYLTNKSDNADSQAAAWYVVYDFCDQNGMDVKNGKCGLENVILFIEELKRKEVPNG